MPDWTYRTLFRPVLFRYPAVQARGWILRALGGLGTRPIGPRLIAWLGHTQPAASLRRAVLGLSLDTPVAFSADLAGNERGLAALARFGVGLVEVGPVALDTQQPARFERVLAHEVIQVEAAGCLPVRLLIKELRAAGPVPARVMVRLAHRPGADAAAAAGERRDLIALLAPYVDAFSLTPPPSDWDMWAWAAHIAQVQAAAVQSGRPLFASATVDDLALAESQLESAYAVGVRGLLICRGRSQAADGDPTGLNAAFNSRARPPELCLGTPALAGRPAVETGRQLGPAALAPAQSLIRRLRARYGPEGVRIMAAAGAAEPAQALDLFTAGADVCGLDSGLVFSGPGLLKRINEALTTAPVSPQRGDSPVHGTGLSGRLVLQRAWVWLAMLGLGLIGAGLAAWGVAHTTVILPYDEAAVGLTLAQIAAINPRLPAFMTHDRVSLAGTMTSTGVRILTTEYPEYTERDRAFSVYSVHSVVKFPPTPARAARADRPRCALRLALMLVLAR